MQKMPFAFASFVSWPDELFEAVRSDLGNVVDAQGRHPKPGEDVELSSFVTESCEITAYPGFLLIFDEDPSFDGEEEPVHVGQVRAVHYRVAC